MLVVIVGCMLFTVCVDMPSCSVGCVDSCIQTVEDSDYVYVEQKVSSMSVCVSVFLFMMGVIHFVKLLLLDTVDYNFQSHILFCREVVLVGRRKLELSDLWIHPLCHQLFH